MAKQQIFQTEQGSTIIYQKQGSFNGYSFAIGFKGGAQLDGKYKGLSHLLEHLLFRTPNPKSTNVLLDNILRFSINQNAYTSQDCICVHFSCTDKNVENALSNCMNNMIGRKSFNAEQIAREIEVIKHEIKMTEEEMSFEMPSAFDCLIESLKIDSKNFNGMDILGTPKTLKTITPEVLKTYVKRYFNAENLIISVTSNKPAEKVLELCQQYILPKVKPATSKKFIVPAPPETQFQQKNLLVAMPNDISETVSICLLLRERSTVSQDFNLECAYDIVEEYLMNNMGGFLYDILRQKNQLVYEFSLSNVDYSTIKFKAFDLATTAPKMRKAISEVCKLIRTIGENGVPKEKFEAVKKVLTDIENANLNKFKSSSASSNFNTFLHNYQFTDYKKVTDHIKNMTYEDFNAHIMQIYSEANVSLAVEGKFDSRKCYNLIEIEKMLGNYSHVDQETELNAPRVEYTDIEQQQTFDMTSFLTMLSQQANLIATENQDQEIQDQPLVVNMDNERID